MSGDWLKSSIAELIKAYKLHENLYNQKHKLYYNKQARNNSLSKILSTVQVSDADSDNQKRKFSRDYLELRIINMHSFFRKTDLKQHLLKLQRKYKR